MKLRNYRANLPKRLSDPEYAAEYSQQTLASGDGAALLIAIKDVQDAAAAAQDRPGL